MDTFPEGFKQPKLHLEIERIIWKVCSCLPVHFSWKYKQIKFHSLGLNLN